MDTQLRTHLLAVSVFLTVTAVSAVGCNLNDPDVVREFDTDNTQTDTSGGDASADSQGDSDDDAGSDTGADVDSDPDTCEERSVAEFCEANSADCGSFTGSALCEDTRTEICGTCSGSLTCVENTCTCISPWSGDGIDAAFMHDTNVFVTNEGYIWAYAPQSGDWSEKEPLSSATSPIDFTLAGTVDGTSLWDDDGPTAAVSTDKAILFFNGSLYWVYDSGINKWRTSGDLNDPAQEDFNLRSGLERNIFGDGTIEAGLSEDRKNFYLINGDVFHEFELQDLNPIDIEQKTLDPVLLENLFPNRWFEGIEARPWENGMTWGAFSTGTFGQGDFVVLGSENQSWIGSDAGPLVYDEVGPDSDIYGPADCTQ